jgi:hypothetical protein
MPCCLGYPAAIYDGKKALYSVSSLIIKAAPNQQQPAYPHRQKNLDCSIVNQRLTSSLAPSGSGYFQTPLHDFSMLARRCFVPVLPFATRVHSRDLLGQGLRLPIRFSDTVETAVAAAPGPARPRGWLRKLIPTNYLPRSSRCWRLTVLSAAGGSASRTNQRVSSTLISVVRLLQHPYSTTSVLRPTMRAC